MRDFEEFGILLGCSENSVPNVATVKRFADVMAVLGYNTLYLETSDTYKIKREPYFGYMRGGYTEEDIRAMDEYCAGRGIELVPAIQTLAHLHFLKNYERFAPILDVDDILLADEEETYSFIEEMFEALAGMYKTRRVNIGMDEAYLLGAGRYYHRHGAADKMEIFLRHLNRVVGIAAKYGFSCEMWSDVFFNAVSKGNVYEAGENAVPEDWKYRVPENLTLVYWEYFVRSEEQCEEMIDKHRQICGRIKYAGTFFRWYGVTPCNVFTEKVMKRALAACKNRGVKHVIFTLWGDYGGGSSLFATLPAMWYLARYAQNGCDESKIDESEFQRLFGVDYKDFTLLDTPNRPYTDFRTKEVSDDRLNNKSHFYLYNDVMYGTFDSLLRDGISAAYGRTAKAIASVRAGEYRYIFKVLAALSSVLAIKADLSKRLYLAYRAGDKGTLYELIKKDMPALLRRIDRYFAAFKVQWLKENKPFGFEVQCIRIGGLKERIRYAAERVEKYLRGETEKIEELEEEHLPLGYAGGADEDSYNITRYQPVAAHGFI